MIGCSISITVEALQFWFMKGFSEVDDVMHNMVGCIFGYILAQGSRFVVKGFQNLWNKPVCKQGEVYI